MSLLGLIVYGIFHVEPIALNKTIEWFAPSDWSPEHLNYYAAQGNATRIFVTKKYRPQLTAWKSIKTIRLSALAYAASGGYSGPQLYPTRLYSVVKSLERVLNLLPSLFATRLLVILEK
jgi:hypothetical protein